MSEVTEQAKTEEEKKGEKPYIFFNLRTDEKRLLAIKKRINEELAKRATNHP